MPLLNLSWQLYPALLLVDVETLSLLSITLKLQSNIRRCAGKKTQNSTIILGQICHIWKLVLSTLLKPLQVFSQRWYKYTRMTNWFSDYDKNHNSILIIIDEGLGKAGRWWGRERGRIFILFQKQTCNIISTSTNGQD